MLAVCAICGASTDVADAKLPNASEPPDFDTRPGEPLRSTLSRWLQHCSTCGYSAEDVSRAAEGAADIVRSTEFQMILGDTATPAPARPFLCYAQLLVRMGQPADAGWSCLHAAWACDDAGAAAMAALCRVRAIAMWQNARTVRQTFGDDIASEFALITDVYRRAGQFEHATVACAEALDIDDIPPVIERILRRQLVIIRNYDTAAHNIRELL